MFVDALLILGLARKTKGHLLYCRDAWVHGRAYVQLRVGLFTSPEGAGRYAEAIHEGEGFDYGVARVNLPVPSSGNAFEIVTTPNDIWLQSGGNEIHCQLACLDAPYQVRRYTAHQTALPR